MKGAPWVTSDRPSVRSFLCCKPRFFRREVAWPTSFLEKEADILKEAINLSYVLVEYVDKRRKRRKRERKNENRDDE